MKQRALLLVNVGTPDKPEKRMVRRYLTEFLNDKRVIDIPWLFRRILVNLIIIPFRVDKSTGLYRRLWTENGSPLLYYLNSLVVKLQGRIGSGVKVYGAMRYGNPSLQTVLMQIKNDGAEEIIVFPMYPQYASSTTGSVVDKLFQIISRWEVIPAIRIVGQFYNHPAFINVLAQKIRVFNPDAFDHIIFSYHGLPMRQINKAHPQMPGNKCVCENEMPSHGTFCYKATCYETSRLLLKKLCVSSEKSTVSFQSRLSENWLDPFTDEVVVQLAKNGAKRVLVVAPAFVADCLETIVEIEDYNHLFKQHGGHELILVPGLNDDEEWVDAVLEIVSGE